MRVLLDTHAFLWWITDSEKLSARARRVIAAADNEVFFSAASGWEIAIKARLGRVVLPEDPERFIPAQLDANGFQILPVHLRHALRVSALPDLHRDPFDRLLIAQAALEGLTILSGDKQLSGYSVKVVW